VRRWQAAAAAAAITVLTAAAADARGTVIIQHAGSGAIDVYHGARITVTGDRLEVTSPDGAGTLLIDRAACVYQHLILVCLPTQVAYRHAGATKPLDLTTGTVYANLTGAPHRLSYSTDQMPPRSVVISLNTARGTYLSVRGRIDPRDAR